MTDFFDAAETRDPARREAEQFEALGPFLSRIVGHAPG